MIDRRNRRSDTFATQTFRDRPDDILALLWSQQVKTIQRNVHRRDRGRINFLSIVTKDDRAARRLSFIAPDGSPWFVRATDPGLPSGATMCCARKMHREMQRRTIIRRPQQLVNRARG